MNASKRQALLDEAASRMDAASLGLYCKIQICSTPEFEALENLYCAVESMFEVVKALHKSAESRGL